MSEKWISCWKICKEDCHPSPHPHWIAESEWAIHFFQPIEPFSCHHKHNETSNQWPHLRLDIPQDPPKNDWTTLNNQTFFQALKYHVFLQDNVKPKKKDFPWMQIWILKPTGECTLIHIAKAKSGWMWGRFVGPDTASDGLALITISTLINPISACYYSELRSAITI